MRCCISHKRTDKTGKRRAIFNLARLLLYHLIDYRRIFSLIDIVEPFLPIGFQITLQVVSVVRAIQNIVINHKKYSEIMKKVFRKIQKGTTKMIERIKSLGEMETKQKCVVQRFEIIIPLHQKITTQYIAEGVQKGKIPPCRIGYLISVSNRDTNKSRVPNTFWTPSFLVIADWTKVSLLLSLSAIMLTERK